VSIKTALMSSNPVLYEKGLEALRYLRFDRCSILTELVGENIAASAHLVMAQLSKGLSSKYALLER
jgi:hypothetical protein